MADTHWIEKVNLYLHTREGEVRSGTSAIMAALLFSATQKAEHEIAAAKKLLVPSVHFQRHPKKRRKMPSVSILSSDFRQIHPIQLYIQNATNKEI